jgi:hypothetical protein
MFAQATTRIGIKRLVLMETGRYDTQFRRPYQYQATGHAINALTEAVGGAQKFTASQLAGVANQIVAPSAQAESTIQIGGVSWNERRLRFMMEVECKQLAGGSIMVTVLGYTDYPGVIVHSAAIDPNMTFYINSIVSVRRTIETTPLGAQTYSNIVDNSHVLVDPNYGGVHQMNPAHKMRPEDVYATMSMSHLGGLSNAVDLRTVLDHQPIASKRSNSVAASYAADMLSGFTRAAVDANFGMNKPEDIFENARGYTQESMLTMNPFFKAITTFRDGFVSNFFSWRDLQALDPNVDNVTVVTMLGQTQMTASSQLTAYDCTMGGAAPWGASDRQTMVATILSQSIPSLMADFGLTVVAFATTNRRVFADAINAAGPFSMQSRISTRIADIQSFAEFDMAPYMDHFVAKLEKLVFTDVSFNNETDFYIEMRADILGETWIKLSLDGGMEYTFVTPSFADALMAPVVTTNNQLHSELSSGMEAVLHHVADHSGMGFSVNNGTQAAPANLFGVI